MQERQKLFMRKLHMLSFYLISLALNDLTYSERGQMKSLCILPLSALAGKCQEKCNSDLEVCLLDCLTQSPDDVRCPGDCARAESDCLFRCQDSNYGLFAAGVSYLSSTYPKFINRKTTWKSISEPMSLSILSTLILPG